MMCRATVVMVCLASIVGAAVVEVPETWPGTSLQGWLSFDPANPLNSADTLSVVSGRLQLTPVVGSESVLNPQRTIIADDGASAGILTGNYHHIGAHTLSFEFYSSVDVELIVGWVNEIGGIVYNTVIPISTGSPILRYDLPLNIQQFSPDLLSFSTEFETLYKNIDGIWFTLKWAKEDLNPIFKIDNVILHGAGSGYGAWIDGYGVDFTNGFAHGDNDFDCILNGDEFIQDLAPNMQNEPFCISCERNVISWNSSTNCQYTIYRSTNLVEGGFEVVETIQGTGSKIFRPLEDAASTIFYNVKVERR